MSIKITFDTSSPRDYQRFLQLKQCPAYHWEGRAAVVPDEYADRFGLSAPPVSADYSPPKWAFDYQRDLATIAIEKQKYAVFADCGLGKTVILLEFARHALRHVGGRVLIVSPLMVVKQTMQEEAKFYDDPHLERVQAKDLADWLAGKGDAIGITNYDAIRGDLKRGNLSALVLDESSMLKSHYGKWGTRLIALGAGLPYKLCCTGTPAPNDRIEYANHAVFLDRAKTVNEFLATYFVNRGETNNRWELKPHALRPFYRALSHWCCFLSDPSVYGWKDNCGNIPPIHVHIDDVPLTESQRQAFSDETGNLFMTQAGGIGSRSVLSQIAKGSHRGEDVETNKPAFIKELIDGWNATESTIVWCHYNAEQDLLEQALPDAGSISGSTPLAERERIIDSFKAGRLRTIISKPKVLGFGLNLQVATRQVFSGLQDSYEEYYQAVKRSNRIGSTKPLNVHIPVTEIEYPMIETVLRKARRVEADTREQEQLFREERDG